MARPKKIKPEAIDIQDEEIVEAVETRREWQVGDNVTIVKDGRKAVVISAKRAPGHKQELVECSLENGSVQSFWFDEIR